MNLKWVWIFGLVLLGVVPHCITACGLEGYTAALLKFAAWWCGLGMVFSGLLITYGKKVPDDESD